MGVKMYFKQRDILEQVSFWSEEFFVNRSDLQNKINGFIRIYGINYQFITSDDYSYGTLLTLAIKDAPVEIVRFLIEQGAAVNIAHHNLLETAVSLLRFEQAKCLIENGANVDSFIFAKINQYGTDYIYEKKIQFVKYLLKHGVGIDENVLNENTLSFATLQQLQFDVMQELPGQYTLENNRLIEAMKPLENDLNEDYVLLSDFSMFKEFNASVSFEEAVNVETNTVNDIEDFETIDSNDINEMQFKANF